ncbi:MAG: SusC/RagA family TonB-linked outer membrane protein, partial [Bacteroidota bacterium]
MKKIFFSLIVCLLAMASAIAQRTVSGKVTDDLGEGLPGVNVVIKGTTTGTTTDFDGNYRLSVQEGAVLVVSFVGFETQEVEVGTRTVIDVTMGGVTELQEVVVTALGIEREKKELGYSVTTVDGDALTKARSSNVLQSLSGRVAGVRVNSSSGTAGGSVNIQIRGANSISGAGSPLFVVDGTPISNSSFNGTRSEIIGGGADVGNRASDLNPDDIESLTVLKGASAVALYGQRARDGVIVVTTKRGKKGAVSIDVNSSVRVSQPFRLPDFQNEYTTGNFGQFDSNNFTNGWGPRISSVQGQTFAQFPYDGTETALTAHPDNVKDFFETGTTFINSVSIGSRNDNGDIRVSYTKFDEEGIVPGNRIERHNVSFNAGTNLSERFSTRAVINYARTEGFNRPRQGSNNPARAISQIFNIPRTQSLELLENNLVDDLGVPIGIDGNQTANNPYWTVTQNPFNNEVDRVFGNASMTYRPNDWIDVLGRIGADIISETRRNILAVGTKSRLNGEFEDRDIFRRELNYDLIATGTRDLNSDLNLTAIVGWNVNQIEELRTRIVSQGLGVPGLYNPANAVGNNNQRFERTRRLYGGYFDVGFGYKDYLFLNVTGRNDWSSTLPVANNSFFYPGVSSSFILSDAVTLPSIISYTKVRASWASVGSDALPYQIDFLYRPLADLFTQFVTNNTFPHGGQLGFQGPDVLPAGQTLKPQRQNTFEVGTEIQFLQGRIGLDVTYYSTITEDQIVNISVAQSTGFYAVTLNIGEVENEGFEMLLSGKPVVTNGFEWEVLANFTRNVQTVNQLAPGLDDLALTSGFSGLSIRAEPGKPFGLYGAGWDRSPDGQIIINSTTGLRERGDRTNLGNIFPDWQMGIENVFTYKGFTLSALVDISQGGVLWSGTVGGIRAAGLAEETLENRGRIFIDPGVNQLEDGTFVTNQTPVRSMQDFWNNYTDGSNTEGGIFDASYIKLREIT